MNSLFEPTAQQEYSRHMEAQCLYNEIEPDEPFELTCTTIETPQPERRSTVNEVPEIDQLNLFFEQQTIKF